MTQASISELEALLRRVDFSKETDLKQRLWDRLPGSKGYKSLIINENIKLLLEKVEKDKDLQKKFSQIHDVDNAYELASKVQNGFTKNEFIDEMKRVYQSTIVDLPEDDLAQAAGGTCLPGNAPDNTVDPAIVFVTSSAI